MNLTKIFALILLLINFSLCAGTIQDKVVGVADGDTITVLDVNNIHHKIRLLGIDAPEKSQAFGQKSKQSLHQLAHGKYVTVEFQKKDKYGRTVGKVLHNDTDFCLEQIKTDRETYALAELAARDQNIGLWKDKTPFPPWEFRRQKSK